MVDPNIPKVGKVGTVSIPCCVLFEHTKVLECAINDFFLAEKMIQYWLHFTIEGVQKLSMGLFYGGPSVQKVI